MNVNNHAYYSNRNIAPLDKSQYYILRVIEPNGRVVERVVNSKTHKSETTSQIAKTDNVTFSQEAYNILQQKQLEQSLEQSQLTENK